jgi:UDP-N-acetylmuramyl pentapeptide phosphotransferase/UDP-N-acetylglucosamine-1-phosphate transferase
LDLLTTYVAGSIALTVFASAGVMHAFNLIDGLNGQASMTAILILLVIAVVASQVGDVAILHLTFSVVGAILGFFIFNFPAAKIFLGDAGAYLLGFMTATLAILLQVRNPNVSPLFALLIVIYPVFETLFSMYRRRYLKSVPVTVADSMHLHSLLYRRLVRVRGASFRTHSRGSAIASAWIWSICLVHLIPAAIWWDNTQVMVGAIVSFAVLYSRLYWRIVAFRIPRWMVKVTRAAHQLFGE